MIFYKQPKYKIDDRIIIKKTCNLGNKSNIIFNRGEKGIIRYLEKTIYGNWIYAIEFDKYNKLRHDLKGLAKKCHGFLVMPQYFRLYKRINNAL